MDERIKDMAEGMEEAFEWEVLDKDGPTFEAKQEDDGIGPYEFWGAKCYDSQPVVRAYVGGKATLTWFETERQQPEECLTLHANVTVDDGDSIPVEITVTPKGEPTVEAVDGGFILTQEVEYDGEGSRSGHMVVDREPDYDRDYDRYLEDRAERCQRDYPDGE